MLEDSPLGGALHVLASALCEVGVSAPRISSLTEFLHVRERDIVDRWERVVRSNVPIARRIERRRLRGVVAEVLAGIAEHLDRRTTRIDAGRLYARHAVDRLDLGYDLPAVITEYAALRRSALELWAREPLVRPGELAAFHDVVDRAIVVATTRFAQARQRTHDALDRLTERGLGSHGIVDLLERFLAVILETVASVDTAAVLLREDDVLRRIVSVGLEEETARGFTVRVGEGFAGRIAAELEPRLLREGSKDPLIESESLRRRGLRVIYGVPLRHESMALGVAHMGSRVATDFSDDDKLALRSLAARAALLIEQHRSREAMRLSEERLDLAAQVAGLGAFDWDIVKGTLQWSDRFKAMLGLPSSTVPGADIFFAVIHPDDREAILAHGTRALDPSSGGEYLNEYRVRQPDGEVRWIQSRGKVFFAEGKPVRLVGTALDITDRKRSEEDRERLIHELDQAVRARDDFVSVLTHDLRNPIGSIALGASLILRQTPETARGLRRSVLAIQKAADRAARMITQLLGEIALYGRKVTLTRKSQDVRGILADAFELFEPAARERSVALVVDVESEPGTVSCDRDYVIRAFGNLVSNAIKFTRAGGTITLRAKGTRDNVTFSVADTGIGISRENCARLFQRGFRGQVKEAGLGLGLAIARSIVEAHGGTIGFESAPGKGSTFWF